MSEMQQTFGGPGREMREYIEIQVSFESMPKCIYCKRSGENAIFNKEHVVPKSFVKGVIDVPTLIGCVCEECNNSFGKELDSYLARDSVEGMQRYRSGIRSSEAQRPHRRVEMKWADQEKGNELPEMKFRMNGKTGKVEPESSYVLINKKTKQKFEVNRNNVDHFDINPWLRKKLSIEMVGKESEMRHLSKRLRKRGLKLKSASSFKNIVDVLPESGQVLIQMTGVIDALTKRAIAKILLNYLAFYLGPELVLKPDFDAIREFIRSGEGSIIFRVKVGIFWDYESETQRMIIPVGVNIKIENLEEGLVGFIQIFDMAIYEIVLAKTSVPDSSLIGHRFVSGRRPMLHKSINLNFGFLIPEYTSDRFGNISINVRKYGRI